MLDQRYLIGVIRQIREQTGLSNEPNDLRVRQLRRIDAQRGIEIHAGELRVAVRRSTLRGRDGRHHIALLPIAAYAVTDFDHIDLCLACGYPLKSILEDSNIRKERPPD